LKAAVARCQAIQYLPPNPTKPHAAYYIVGYPLIVTGVDAGH